MKRNDRTNDSTDAPSAGTEPATKVPSEGTSRSPASRSGRYLATGASLVSAALGARTLLASATHRLRRLDPDDALAWLGLARRRSPFALAGAFGAGAMVGAGVTLLVAPLSGKELRALLAERFVTKAPGTHRDEAEESTSDETAPASAAHKTARSGDNGRQARVRGGSTRGGG